MKVRLLEDVLKTHPDFKPGWTEKPHGGMENPRFGRLSHIVICEDDGTPKYDQYMIEEKPGSIAIPYDEKKGIVRVGLVTQERAVPERNYTELPRGFGVGDETTLEIAYRENLEETGLRVSDEGVRLLGRININSTFYRTDVPIVAICFKDLDEMGDPEGDKFAENLLKATPYDYNQVKDLIAKEEIECSMTQAALFRFAIFKPEFVLGKKAAKYQHK